MSTTSKQPRLNLIAAMSENRVIGIKNHLPWHLPDEWKNFKRVTGSAPFIMGRTSFTAPDALHSPYLNVILTTDPDGQKKEPDVVYAADVPNALALLSGETDVFILGGATVFREMLPLADRLYLTIVHTELDGDAYFPVFDQNEWELTESVYHGTDAEHAFSFSMNVYQKKPG